MREKTPKVSQFCFEAPFSAVLSFKVQLFLEILSDCSHVIGLITQNCETFDFWTWHVGVKATFDEVNSVVCFSGGGFFVCFFVLIKVT